MGTLAVIDAGDVAAELAARSLAWDRATDARLIVGVVSDQAKVIGAFERALEPDLLRRGSGGGTALLEPGSIWMQLALPRADALLPCSADKLLNRYVRPLLRALTRVTSVPCHYFGRDWVSAAHRPVALLGFAHDASSGRCLVEAIVGLHAPSASARASFMGKAPAALHEIARAPVEARAVREAIVAAYSELASDVRHLKEAAVRAEPCVVEAPWAATRDEAIGTIGAGRDETGRMRVGGEFMASRDTLARLEAALAVGGVDLDAAVDEALGAPGVVTFGVRSHRSIRDVIAAALGTEEPAARWATTVNEREKR